MGKLLNEVIFGFNLNNILNIIKGNIKKIPDFYGPINKIEFADIITIIILTIKKYYNKRYK